MSAVVNTKNSNIKISKIRPKIQKHEGEYGKMCIRQQYKILDSNYNHNRWNNKQNNGKSLFKSSI